MKSASACIVPTWSRCRPRHQHKGPLVFDDVLGDSPEHWEWVRKNLSQRPELATEAWATLGAYRDKFFERNPRHDWMRRPWVQNTEKHLVQRDVPGWSKPGFNR